jgi:alpha-glucuronidase
MRLSRHIGLLLLSTLAAVSTQAETGAQGWLRYAPIVNKAPYATLPSQIVVPGNTPTDRAAAQELQRGLTSMLGRPFTIAHETEDNTNAIILTNLATLSKAFTISGDKLPPESYTLGEKTENHTHRFIILGADPRGELYGAFHLLELVASQQPLPTKPTT